MLKKYLFMLISILLSIGFIGCTKSNSTINTSSDINENNIDTIRIKKDFELYSVDVEFWTEGKNLYVKNNGDEEIYIQVHYDYAEGDGDSYTASGHIKPNSKGELMHEIYDTVNDKSRKYHAFEDYFYKDHANGCGDPINGFFKTDKNVVLTMIRFGNKDWDYYDIEYDQEKDVFIFNGVQHGFDGYDGVGACKIKYTHDKEKL